MNAMSLPRRTPVSPETAAAFANDAKVVLAPAAPAAPAPAAPAPAAPAPAAPPAPALVAPHARLSVEISAETLRKLKIRAIEKGTTIRAYVIAVLARDGL